MLRAENLRRVLVPRCSTDVWRKPRRSIPGAHLELLGMERGEGRVQVWCPTWTQWNWQRGSEGDPEPWSALGEGRGGAEGAGHAQDGTHRTGWHVLTLSWAELHPSATGKWVQALSWFPLGRDGSDSSPWAVLTPLAAGLWQLQNLPCSQCDSMAGTCCCRCACVLWLGL